MHLIHPLEIAREEANRRPNPISVVPLAAKSDPEPMVLRGGIIAQQGGFSPGIENNDIDIAIVVQVVKGGPATAPLNRQAVSSRR